MQSHHAPVLRASAPSFTLGKPLEPCSPRSVALSRGTAPLPRQTHHGLPSMAVRYAGPDPPNLPWAWGWAWGATGWEKMPVKCATRATRPPT